MYKTVRSSDASKLNLACFFLGVDRTARFHRQDDLISPPTISGGGGASSSPAEVAFTKLALSEGDRDDLSRLARRFGADFIELRPISAAAERRFVDGNFAKLEFLPTLKEICVRGGGDPGVRRYNVEYGTFDDREAFEFQIALREACGGQSALLARAEEIFRTTPNYGFVSPLTDRASASMIIDFRRIQSSGRVVDVGCGNGELLTLLKRACHLNPNDCLGIDTSAPSASLVRNVLGLPAVCGSLPEVMRTSSGPPVLELGSVGALFLSYFIDRDSDQRGTLDVAAQLVSSAGQIILEGLFPVKPFDSMGVRYADEATLLTAGESAGDDVRRVVEYMATRDGARLTLSKIAVGERLVYSLDGFERLPSISLVFEKGEE